MRIKKIELKNFKRFTDLTISDIPETSKLVLLIGSNGSGKSSVFDAFDWVSKALKGQYGFGVRNEKREEANYYKKDINEVLDTLIEFYDGKVVDIGITVGFAGMENSIERKEIIKILLNNSLSFEHIEEIGKKFIGRSSVRIIPRISDPKNRVDISLDIDKPDSYIDIDTRFINDVFFYTQQINNAARVPIFNREQQDLSKIVREFIEPLNYSLINIFGGDATTTIQIINLQDSTPSSPANLIFKKGASEINYDLLSHGEKQVVILLINFIVRKEYYKDCIIFIDEMDCHLNTNLQSNLLNEIVTQWIPDDAQLWTASHALGFIDYARKSENASIIDLDLLNFDTKIEIAPTPKDNLEVYEIAVPKAKIATIFKDYKLVVVENKNDEHFNDALAEVKYLFLPADNNREVFLTVKGDKGKNILGLRDRDYLRVDEIKKIKADLPNLKILLLSTFENYIYHPDNIDELGFIGFDKEEYIREITNQKNDKLIDIVAEIGTSRTHYIEFKDDSVKLKNDEDVKSITNALQSNNLDEFYQYFNMKRHFNKTYLTKFKYTVTALSKTNWFKNEILKILNS